MKITKKLKAILKSPYFSLIMGAILIFCGIMETAEFALEHFIGIEIGTQHGLIIFGMSHILISMIHIVDGLENISLSQLEKEVQEIEKK